MQLPPGHGRCELSHRRTLAPTKPNLELETVCNCPPPGTEGAPHAHRRTLATTKPNLELETVCKRARPCYNLLDSITIRYKFFYLIKK